MGIPDPDLRYTIEVKIRIVAIFEVACKWLRGMGIAILFRSVNGIAEILEVAVHRC